LSGTAKVWYKTLPVEEKRNYNKFREKLVKAFQRIDILVRKLQELVERIQKDEEMVGTYAYEKMKLCNQMDRNISERNRVIYFIQGLRKNIQTFVILKEPENMDQALQMARRKKESLIDIEKDKERLKIQNIGSQDSRKNQNLILEKLEELSTKIRKIDNANRGRKGVDLKGRVIYYGCGRPGHYIRSCSDRQKESKKRDKNRKEKKESTNNTWRKRIIPIEMRGGKISNIME
jgi:hypothetical protein